MTSNRKRASYHHGDLRSALSDAGIDLLAEVGTDFTLRQVAKRVGVTHGAAYRHFEDREALLAELARRGFVDLKDRLESAMRTAPHPRGRLEVLLKSYLAFAWERRAQYEVMFGRRLNEAGGFPELEEAVQAAVRFLQTAVSEYLEDDDPVRARDVGIGLWSFAHGFTTNVLRRRIHVRSLRTAQSYIVRVARPFLIGARAE
ncbi:MAG: TetR/AcrR family transcriptional regulator [Polyangiales bacterium]